MPNNDRFTTLATHDECATLRCNLCGVEFVADPTTEENLVLRSDRSELVPSCPGCSNCEVREANAVDWRARALAAERKLATCVQCGEVSTEEHYVACHGCEDDYDEVIGRQQAKLCELEMENDRHREDVAAKAARIAELEAEVDRMREVLTSAGLSVRLMEGYVFAFLAVAAWMCV